VSNQNSERIKERIESRDESDDEESDWEPEENMIVSIRWGDDWCKGKVRRALKSKPGMLLNSEESSVNNLFYITMIFTHSLRILCHRLR
jgi:hypothetical protein